MTQQSGSHLNTKEIARKIEELVNQTPPEVMETMKKGSRSDATSKPGPTQVS